MDEENEQLKLQERCNIEQFSREISRNSSGYSSEQDNSQRVESEDVEQSYKADMLRRQLACLTTNGATNADGSGHLLDSESNTAREDLNSVSVPAAVHEASTGGEFDSTDSIKFPSPPTDSPGLAETSAQNCDRVSPVSGDVVDSFSSHTSCDSYKSYLWSSADSDLPSSTSRNLKDDEEILIWPLQVRLCCKTASIITDNQCVLLEFVWFRNW